MSSDAIRRRKHTSATVSEKIQYFEMFSKDGETTIDSVISMFYFLFSCRNLNFVNLTSALQICGYYFIFFELCQMSSIASFYVTVLHFGLF